MSFEIGNRFWENRSVHGRDRIFTDSSLLLCESYKYFESCVENPLFEVDYVGKDAIEVKRFKVKAFTIRGLCIFLGVNSQYFAQFKQSLEGKTDDLSRDFSLVITHVMETIEEHKFVNAAAGLLNATIISRDLGLTDKIETNIESKNRIRVVFDKTNREVDNSE